MRRDPLAATQRQVLPRDNPLPPGGTGRRRARGPGAPLLPPACGGRCGRGPSSAPGAEPGQGHAPGAVSRGGCGTGSGSGARAEPGAAGGGGEPGPGGRGTRHWEAGPGEHGARAVGKRVWGSMAGAKGPFRRQPGPGEARRGCGGQGLGPGCQVAGRRGGGGLRLLHPQDVRRLGAAAGVPAGVPALPGAGVPSRPRRGLLRPCGGEAAAAAAAAGAGTAGGSAGGWSRHGGPWAAGPP